MNWIVHSLVKNWFLCGIVLGILLAWAVPEIGMKGGPLHPEITIKYFGEFSEKNVYFGNKQIFSGELHFLQFWIIAEN